MRLFSEIKFNEKGLIPAIITDAVNNQVLTLCYMNEDALRKTIETGKVYVFRRSQNRLMLKGETSGHIQTIKEIFFDCEGNSLVFKVEQKVAACHAGYRTCYFRRYDPQTDSIQIVENKVFVPENVYK